MTSERAMTINSTAADLAGAIQSDGYVIVPDAVDPSLCDALVDEIRRIEVEHQTRNGANDFEGFETRRVYNLLAKSSLFRDVPVLQNVLDPVEAVLGQGCLLSGMTSIDIGPDETPQLLHADDGMITLPRPHPATMVTTLWALSEFTEANGATRVVPGSHLRPTVPRPGEQHPSIAAEMPKGGVCFLHASTWHGGGANTTGSRRYGLSVQYVAGWCRQQQNLMLGLDRDLVAAFSQRLQELVGYSVYRNVMGHVDRQHPASLLGHDRSFDSVWDKLDGPDARGAGRA